MGFTLKDFEDAAARKFAGLEIEDGPNGKITLRSVVRLSDAETAKFDAAQKKVKEIQEAEDGSPSDLRAAMVTLLTTLADKPADLKLYLRSCDLGVVSAIYAEYAETTKAAEGN